MPGLLPYMGGIWVRYGVFWADLGEFWVNRGIFERASAKNGVRWVDVRHLLMIIFPIW